MEAIEMQDIEFVEVTEEQDDFDTGRILYVLGFPQPVLPAARAGWRSAWRDEALADCNASFGWEPDAVFQWDGDYSDVLPEWQRDEWVGV